MPYFPGLDDEDDEDVGGVATADEDNDPSSLLKTRRDDPLDPLGVVDDGDPAGSVPTMAGVLPKQSVETPSAVKPPTAPGPTHFPRPALDKYRDQTSRMPELPDPSKANKWAKLANIAYGAGAGWTNAAGRTHVDPNAARELLRPGYSQAMQKWQMENEKLRHLADLEQKQTGTDLQMETQAARKEAYAAMKARAERPPGQGTPAKPSVDAPEEVAKRQQIAAANGWTEETHPGVTQWIASRVWGHPPAPKTAPVHKHPTNAADRQYDEDLPPEERNRAKREVQLGMQRKEHLANAPSGAAQGGSGEEKPLNRNQRIIQGRRAEEDKDKAYRDAEAEFGTQSANLQRARKSPDPAVRQTAEAAYQKLVADHTARKQAIEERYKRSAEDISGQPQPRVKFGNSGNSGNPPIAAPPVAQPPAQSHKVTSRATIEAFARTHNLTPEQAIAAAQRDGYVIQ
jgi:LysM repeat protein